MSDTRRIVKNTLILYFRQLIIIPVGLYAVRVVLNILGTEDYGIYNVVTGVVAMFGFLSGSLATTSQRYFSFELGKEDLGQLNKTFCFILTICIFICIIVLILSETIGVWFINNKLVIPPERKDAAQWIYQFSILSFILNIILLPYLAVLIARENMGIYAASSISEALLKLGIIYLLYIIPFDKLKLYSTLISIVTIINTGIFCLICVKKYKECKFRFYWNYNLLKGLGGYINWNIFANISDSVKKYGINILFNIYFGPLINAAQAVAQQVNDGVATFIQNFIAAFKPPIIKNYAANNHSYLKVLIFTLSKMSFFLLFIIILPAQLELKFLLALWLKQVPEYAIIFTRITLLNLLIGSIVHPFVISSQATGKVKLYQFIVGSILILNLPLSFVILHLGFSPTAVLIIGFVLATISIIAGIIIVSKQLHFSLYEYIYKILVTVIIVAILSSILPVLSVILFKECLVRFFLTIIISIISVSSTVFFVGLSKIEKSFVINEVKQRIFKLPES